MLDLPAPRRLERLTQPIALTLRSRNLRHAQLSFGLAWAAEWAVTVIVGILAFRHGGALAVGAVGLARTLPAALVAPLAAVLVDRYRRERVLIGVGLLRGAALAGAALAVGVFSAPLLAYALVACEMLAHALYRPAHSALLPSICTTATELTSANVVRGMLDSLSALLGPLTAWALIDRIGVSGVLGVCAAGALWSAWLIAGVHYEVAPRLVEVVPARATREAVEGVRIVSRRPEVRLPTILACLQTFTRGCFAVFSVVVALRLLGLPESGVGLLTAAFGAGAVLGSFGVSLLVRTSNFGRWLAVGVASWGLPFVVLAAVTGEVPAVALLAVVGIANAIVDLSYFTMLQWLVPDELMGRVFASAEALLTLGVAVGYVATPGLIALFGIRGALVVAGLVAPFGAVLGLSRLRRIDARMRAAGEVVALLQRVGMLAPLPLATITQLAASASPEEASPGTIVVQQGSRGDDFYVIAEGQAEILTDGVTVGHLGPEDCFGEIAALGGTSRVSTVRSRTHLRLLRFNGPHFVRAVTGYTPSSVAASTLVNERLVQRSSTIVPGVRDGPRQPPAGPESDRPSDRPSPGAV